MTSTRPDPVIRTKRQSLRRDPNSVVASAALMTGPSRSKAKIEPTDWHKLAWSFYDDVGELRAAVSWKANALSRVNLVAAVVPTVQGDEPTFIDQTIPLSPVAKRALELTEQIAGGPSGQGQLLAALTRQIEVAGVAYYLAVADPITDTFTGTWRALSADEVRRQGGRDQVADPESGEWEDLQESDLLVKVWRAHPRRAWEPDSPVRGCLGSLAEIRLLSQRIAADARSRLTGAGLLLVDNKIEFAPGQGQSGAPEDADDFVQTLMDIASIAPSDPEGPSANVPLVAKLPGDSVDKVQLIKFWSELSAHADELRTAAVRRFALGMDMPPDILLGLGDANHWSGWLITEEAIGMHVEPLAETLAHGFTVGFLKPALKAEGFTQAEVDTVMVWYDASDLSTRPDLSTAAGEAHGKRLISDDAYLGYLGLDAGDRPAEDELRRRILLDFALANQALAPVILQVLGLLDESSAALVDAAVNAQTATPPEPPVAAPVALEPAVPAQEPPAMPVDAPAPSDAGLLAAADGLVYRALERAGNRLRNSLGKDSPQGAGGVAAPSDLSLMHTTVDAASKATLSTLLAGAWDRVPEVAARYDVDPASLTACLDAYSRALLAAGHAHTLDRLADALGVGDGHRLTAA